MDPSWSADAVQGVPTEDGESERSKLEEDEDGDEEVDDVLVCRLQGKTCQGPCRGEGGEEGGRGRTGMRRERRGSESQR